MMTAFAIGVTLLIIINLAVSFGVLRSASYSRNQKIAQVAFIFLLPVAGAAIVWLFLREASPSLSPAKENPDADRDDLKTVGMDAPGSYGSPDQY
jgi:hypothetical protein